MYRYCYYGEGHDGEKVDYHDTEAEARAAARKAVADAGTKEADIWWESVVLRWVCPNSRAGCPAHPLHDTVLPTRMSVVENK